MDADDLLEAELKEALRRSKTAGLDVTAMADAAWAWRGVDADLALLAHDSMADPSAAVRGPRTVNRLLVFESPTLSVELETSDERLVGQLVPPVEGEVTLFDTRGEVARASADELGCFSLRHHASGPVRLRCRAASHDIVTEWVRL